MKSNQFEALSLSVAQMTKLLQQLKRQKMAEYGLRGATALCLCQLLESDGGLTAGELATLGEIDKAQVSRCMKELLDEGFAYREEREGRCYRQKYCLTETGRAAARDINGTARVMEEALGKRVTDAELDGFYKTLYKLTTGLSAFLEKDGK